ncbi:calcium-binding protein [Polaromonas sp. YR568]|uniref:calcium-binding protein n=1 Tax=Polaromonas sp. YR568 TaxID=1855301 RepID=UPI00398BF038
MSTDVNAILKYANLQMAAEALLDTVSQVGIAKALSDGNNRTSRFTTTQADQFIADGWTVVDHKPNTSTGFSGTLFKNALTGEYVMSFRSTEFIDDSARDSVATNTLEIKEKGWAFGQIADMEAWYASLTQSGSLDPGVPLTVTGYSLGGHLATAFNLLHKNDLTAFGAPLIKSTYTFNGAGVGSLNMQGHSGVTLSGVIQDFVAHRGVGANASRFTTEEGRTRYASLSLLFSPGSVVVPEAVVAAVQELSARLEQPIVFQPTWVELNALRDALRLMLRVTNEAVRVTGISNNGGSPPVGVSTDQIEAATLDYQLAVLGVSDMTRPAIGLTGGAYEGVVGRNEVSPPIPNFYDVYGSNFSWDNFSAVSNSQWHHGKETAIFIEDQPLYRGNIIPDVASASWKAGEIKLLVPEFSQNDFGDTHSLSLLIDSLSVQNALAQLDPAANQDTLNAILRASANHRAISAAGTQGVVDGDTLENLVNALGAYLGVDKIGDGWIKLKGNLAGGTWANIDDANGYTGRDSLHKNLNLIAQDPDYQDLMGKVTIEAGTSGFADRAKKDFGILIALQTLSPFLLKAKDAAGQTTLNELWDDAWGDEYALWQTDKAAWDVKSTLGIRTYTDTWLADRAEMLKWSISRNNANIEEIRSPGFFEPLIYSDVNSSMLFSVANTNANAQSLLQAKRVLFGGDGVDELSGEGKDDHLYGGEGDDILNGKAGVDYLEGGTGDDTLIGGDGDDTLLGGKDFDTYQFTDTFGQDTILDSDGSGVVKIGAATLNGGKETPAGSGIWLSEDKKWRYVLQPGSDGGQNLIIYANGVGGNRITVKNFQSGQLGIILDNAPTPTAPPNPNRIIVGDLKPVDTDPVADGVQTGVDDLGNILTLVGQADADRADTLYDSAGNDWLQGKGGGDILYATRGGDDRLEGGAGNDYADGGAGKDTVDGGDGDDRLDGGTGNDILIGGADKDIIQGGDDDDHLYGNLEVATDVALAQGHTQTGTQQKGDWLNGGNGDDILIAGSDNDVLFGGTGEDVLVGGAGDDVLNGDDDYTAANTDWSTSAASNGNFFDTLWVGIYNNNPTPLTGGADVLYGGAGNDRLHGLWGNDLLFGDEGDDVMSGDEGGDLLFGGTGNDKITGDSNRMTYSDGTPVLQGDDYLDGGDGDDELYGEGGDDTLIGGAGDDKLTGDNGTHLTMQGDDTLDGGDGNDELNGSGGSDHLIGGAGDDHLSGDWDNLPAELQGDDLLDGGDGDDVLLGAGGDDTLFGGEGKDDLQGGSGDDFLDGGAGDDKLMGGAGEDMLVGGEGADVLLGDVDDDFLEGGAGNDIMQGGTGEDMLVGGEGDDGLQGGDNDDILQGGAGTDTLEGGSGDDTYIFNLGDGHDTLRDTAGTDTLVFGGGITPADIVFSRSAYDLVLRLQGTEDLLVIPGWGSDAAARIEKFEFADGTVWDAAFINAQVALAANRGTSGDDLMSAWIDEDATTMQGGDGNDFYLVHSRTQLARERANQGYDTVQSTVDYTLGSNLERLLLTGDAVKGTGNQLDNELFGNEAGNVLTGGGGSDYLAGGDGDDYLDGGADYDALVGGAGANIYSLKLGSGHDHIDVLSTLDSIVFGAGITLSSLVISNTPGGMLLHYGTQGDDALFISGTPRDLQFADGSRISMAQLLAAQGGYEVTGNDEPLASVDTSYWARKFTDSHGNDVILGGGTNTIYHFNIGGGVDSLMDLGGQDVLSFGGGISVDDIRLEFDRNSVSPSFKVHYGEGDVVSIVLGQYGSIEQFLFADGTVLSFSELALLKGFSVDTSIPDFGWTFVVDGMTDRPPVFVDGTSGDDTIRSNNDGDGIYVGGKGNDTISIGENDKEGRSTLVFNLDDGQDTVIATYHTSLVFGAGIDPGSLRFRQVNRVVFRPDASGHPVAHNVTDTVIDYGDRPNDRVILDGFYNGGSIDKIESFEFADGRRFSYQQLQSLAPWYAPPSGGGGEADPSVLRFNLGDGVVLMGGAGTRPTVQFGLGIDASMLRLSRDPLAIRVGDNGDQLHLTDFNPQNVFAPHGVQIFLFADGSSLSYAQLIALGFDLKGTEFDDVLVGTNTTDRINGGDGNDTLSGGAGNDMLAGGQGGDVYLFGRGDGIDRIYDFGPTVDRVVFAASIQTGDVEVSRNGDDLELHVAGSLDTLVLSNWYVSDAYKIELVQFADGTVWDVAQLQALVPVPATVGTEGDDTLYSPGGLDNPIEGQGGNDLLLGSGIADLMDGGDGEDELVGDSGDDLLAGGAGDDALDGGSGNDTLDGGLGDDTLDGGDGNDTLEAGAGNDHLKGGGGDDVLKGGLGNDTLNGGAGNDILNAGDGDDSLHGEGGNDALDGGVGNDMLFGGDGGDTLEAGDGNDALYGDGGNDVLHGGLGNDVLSGDDGDDTLEAGDGTDTLGGGGGNDTLAGGLGDDFLGGGEGDDTLDGGLGDDTLEGGIGNDTYVFGRGSGRDVIYDYEEGAGNTNTLRFDATVSAADIKVTRDDGNLYLSIDGTEDRVTVYGWFYDDENRIEQVEFADGTVWQQTDLLDRMVFVVNGTEGGDYLVGTALADEIQGLGGNDTLYGNDGNDVLDGGAGDDSLQGGDGDDALEGGAGADQLQGNAGSDVYLFGRGAGRDSIYDYDQAGGDVDIIRFDATVAAADIRVTRDDGNLYLSIDGTADRITLENWLYGDENKAKQVEFSDGTVWDAAMLESLITAAPGTEDSDVLYGSEGADLLSGLGGDDNLYANGGNDTLDGGAGNDYMDGGAGSDVYLFGRGSGQDWIDEYNHEEGDVDTILLDASVSVGDVRVIRDSGSLYISIDGTTDRISLNNWFNGDDYKAKQLEFADGTVWDAAMLESLVAVAPATEESDIIYGTEVSEVFNALGGDDQVYGNGGDDTLNGGAGNDYLDGGSGNDVFLFSRGDGSDYVVDYDETSGNIDTLRFDATVSAGDITVTRDVSSLYLAINGTSDQITLSNWFGGDAYKVERIEFDDGTVWDPAMLESLLNVEPGTEDGDVRYGTEGADAINGLGGDDTLYGGGGADILSGGEGNDNLDGANGSDVLEGGAGNDYITDSGGGNYYNGGAGNDYLSGSGATDFLMGGIGNDAIRSGDGPDVIAFNVGDGQDTVYADGMPNSQDDTLSLGGAGLDYANLVLQKNGNDLVLQVSESDSLTFSNWYGDAANQSVLNLQLVAEAMAAFDAGSSDPLLNKKVQTFDFQGLVGAFDAARTATPGLSNWALSNGLTQFHLAGSDSEALGGDLAYHYGADGTLAGIGLGKAQDVLANAQFGAQAQAINSTASLQEGLIRLG